MRIKVFDTRSTPVFTIFAIILVGATNIMAAPGHLDPTFSGDGRLADAPGQASEVGIQQDGKIVVIDGMVVVRFNPDGTPDTSFGGGTGRVSVNFGFGGEAYIRGFAIQSDGKIVVGGVSEIGSGTGGPVSFGVVRFNLDGSPDPSFGGGTGIVRTALSCGNFNDNFGAGFAIQPDGKMVGAVRFDYCNGELLRYRSDGSLDPSFGVNGNGTIAADVSNFNAPIAIQSNGKIVVVGSQRLLRFESHGSPDLGFNAGFQRFLDIYSVIMQPDNKIVACGPFFDGSQSLFRVARYNVDGSPDPAFGGNGSVTIEIGLGGDIATSVAIQADGRIVVAGIRNGSSNDSSKADFALVRYNVDGSLDSTFGSGDGITTTDFDNSLDFAWALALDTTGRAVVVGESAGRLAIARFLLTSTTPFDFDGDGRSDISVFRPSDRNWYLDRSTAGFTATQFGISTDTLTPSDYDGDGKTDVSVYRDGTWYWLNSSDGSFRAIPFGIASDVPVPADFSGDGRSELAVYRGGIWFSVNLSNNQVNSIQFGIAADKPVVADYDGDGLSDQAVYRNGTWHLNRSTEGYTAVNFGLASDKPAVGDYDGDGRADPAVYRGGTWYMLGSQGGFKAIQFGVASDTPVPADYDGDSTTDPAVYRGGVWYSMRSTTGFSATNFGLTSDFPVPSTHLR